MLGRVLLTVDCIGLLFGAIIADWNETHVYNSRWPPHAKFHNAQTITLSVILGLATLFLTWRPYLQDTSGPKRLSPELARDSLRMAAFTGSIYWIAGLAAAFFPGTSGLDPEFGGPGFPQKWLFMGFGACGLLGGAVLS
ncbi:hypothetical protein MCOR27_006754 [Pyricularia oryzae]|uniref:Uncharacterized protein n=2 Tax=Pyricularia TaxID=48558 RepID=A0ABQ8NU13_PYRGI|nr:hypothetical protein MCOR01_010766 [Pyricularia oryzae]KAI6300798.1 hypothetical protein MCOR33_003543 [Pyricularia grisea]KAH9438213.1 hypothetical protein MCOR02_001851 [Pyricularia oryzae]KAI6263692.1 hypothetical protein MCOR19_000025 [Pyricularia oryzae]KAI6275917.1 hypothetical protein MCOR27_006754 [Pyricularia oryzae]